VRTGVEKQGTGTAGEIIGAQPREANLPIPADTGWDHELALGDDLRSEARLLWKETVVVLIVLGVAAVRFFLV